MPDKSSKKKPEIPQPRPDIILPGENNAADCDAHADLRAASPLNEVYQQAFQGCASDHEGP